MKKLLNIFNKIIKPVKKDKSPKNEQMLTDFRLKFYSFQSLLSINNDILIIMTNLEKLEESKHIFILEDLRVQIIMLEVKIYKLIRNLNELCENKYIDFYDRLKNILNNISEKLQPQNMPLTLPFGKISKEMSMLVGGKNSHLGELKTLGFPVPDGFAITTYAYEKFINYNGLHNKIMEFLKEFNPANLELSLNICKNIHEMIMKHPLPPELEKEFLDSYVNLGEHDGDVFNIAVRSSAVGEDSEKSSYAGQYSSVLNVSEHTLFDAFRKVISSKYNLRTILYQINMWLKSFDIPIAVCCMKMVDAKAAGVLYTIDPSNSKNNNSIIINAVWGLGEYLVEGRVNSDHYTVSKNTLNIISRHIASQSKMLVCINDINGGVKELDVPDELINKQCLTDEQILQLANYSIKVENYYKKPQDIEWVLDKNNNLLIVQSRALQLTEIKSKKISHRLFENLKDKNLINKGEIIYHGVASGIAYHVKELSDIFDFPQGAVLILEKSAPVYSVILNKTSAVITDIGSVTGHLASVIREFNIPAIFNTEDATKVIPHGELITVDAYNGMVLKGKIEELLEAKNKKKSSNGIKENPLHKTLSEILDFIVPLNLIDPKSIDFVPANCHTLHDITRFCHELAVQTMFRVSDKSANKTGSAKKLDINIPLNIYVIDLGDGIKDSETLTGNTVTSEQIVSIPMQAILKGMCRKDMSWAGPTNIDFQGFFSVIAHVAVSAPDYERPLGEGSYFAISKNYMNFNSRLAYHFAIVDTYCSDVTNNNYIIFRFKGGGAAIDRRLNRIRFLSTILQKLGFNVNTNEDLLHASIYKYEQHVIEEKLDLLGRLMCFSRQLDMCLSNENIINIYVNAFLNENYSFHCQP